MVCLLFMALFRFLGISLGQSTTLSRPPPLLICACVCAQPCSVRIAHAPGELACRHGATAERGRQTQVPQSRDFVVDLVM